MTPSPSSSMIDTNNNTRDVSPEARGTNTGSSIIITRAGNSVYTTTSTRTRQRSHFRFPGEWDPSHTFCTCRSPSPPLMPRSPSPALSPEIVRAAQVHAEAEPENENLLPLEERRNGGKLECTVTVQEKGKVPAEDGDGGQRDKEEGGGEKREGEELRYKVCALEGELEEIYKQIEGLLGMLKRQHEKHTTELSSLHARHMADLSTLEEHCNSLQFRCNTTEAVNRRLSAQLVELKGSHASELQRALESQRLQQQAYYDTLRREDKAETRRLQSVVEGLRKQLQDSALGSGKSKKKKNEDNKNIKGGTGKGKGKSK